jgi:hypothetical protein
MTSVDISASVISKTAARLRPESGSAVRVPSVDVRPTSSHEKSTLPDHAMGPGHEARMMWSGFPEMNVQETLRTMNEARATPSGASEPTTDDAWKPSSPTRSRCTSAASSRTPGHSRPGSGPTRSSAQHLRNLASTQSSLLAADAQNMMSASMGLDEGVRVPRSAASGTEFRPHSSSFVASLRFATPSGLENIDVRPVSSLRAAVHHHRRTITRAPISLLKQFEQRVRSSTPYAPLGTGGGSHSREALLAEPVLGPLDVAPRVQCSEHQPNRAFHTRGDYTADVVNKVLDELGYFSFREQIVRDIHDKGRALRQDVEHARAERSMMAGLRHDTMKSEIAFWQQNRPPTIVDLEQLLPGKGNNTRDVNVFVGKLVEHARVSVESKVNRVGHAKRSSVVQIRRDARSPPPIRWKSNKERTDYYKFVGRDAPSLAPPIAPPTRQ